jgi:hypothetical protein
VEIITCAMLFHCQELIRLDLGQIDHQTAPQHEDSTLECQAR